MRISFLLVLISSVYTADDRDFKNCSPIEDPVGSHPVNGEDVTAGRLSLSEEGDDLVATVLCDEDKGFVPVFSRPQEMRCSWDGRRQAWAWNHHHRQRHIPGPRCSRISPKPLLLKYKLGFGFTGCDNKDGKKEFEGLVRERIISTLSCALNAECKLSEVTCLIDQVNVIIKLTILSHVQNQRLLLESAAQFLGNLTLIEPESVHRQKRQFDPSVETETSSCASVGEVEDGAGCKTCGAGTYADQDNQVCGVCDFNEYSVGSVNECTACGDGLGTLEQQSTSAGDCQGNLYERSQGLCRGGDSPADNAGEKFQGYTRDSCDTICDADKQCTGYLIPMDSGVNIYRDNRCYTYTSRNAVGDGHPCCYCYMKIPCHAVNGNWGGWSSWSSCDCTRDIKTRTRQCNNPAPSCGGASCFGSSSNTDSCLCVCQAVNGDWGGWSSWSWCDCTRDIKTRTRQCDNPAPSCEGASCSGSSNSTDPCFCANYERSQGLCSGGDSPANTAGMEYRGENKDSCDTICDADMQCTGYSITVNTRDDRCWTYKSRNAVGNGYSNRYCYMKSKCSQSPWLWYLWCICWVLRHFFVSEWNRE